MIRLAVRVFVKGVLVWVLVCAELVVGIPVGAIALMTIWNNQRTVLGRSAWQLYCSLLIMSIFNAPWVVVMVILYGCYSWVRLGQVIVSSKTVRLLMISGIGSIIISWIAPGKMVTAGWIYTLVALTTIALVMKREQLHTRTTWENKA